jgi:hypothetical protein
LKVAQAVGAEIAEDDASRRIVASELMHGLGEQDLTAVAGG